MSLHRNTRLLLAVSALSLVAAYFVPLWRILLWAPQYPEGLEMKIWINTLSGDVKIISALNHYIGMRQIEVSMFPEFGYLFALWGKRIGLLLYLGILIAAGVAALVDFYLWGYDYGHNLDPEAAIKVEGMTYQPPLIGTKVLLNFTAFSGPDIGGWIFMASGVLVFGLCAYELYFRKKTALS
jgi:copper chaperone NosL